MRGAPSPIQARRVGMVRTLGGGPGPQLRRGPAMTAVDLADPLDARVLRERPQQSRLGRVGVVVLELLWPRERVQKRSRRQISHGELRSGEVTVGSLLSGDSVKRVRDLL